MTTQSYSYQIWCNTIYILESLDKCEEKTGKWLFEDIVPLTYDSDLFEVKYERFQSKYEFFQLLKNIEIEVGEQRKLPIIHIEAHGDHLGFEVAQNKECISWKELNIKLSKINHLSQNNTILSLGICEGHYVNLDMITYFHEGQRCPYISNISPMQKISNQDIKFGYSAFYQSLLKERDFGTAMRSMNSITPLNFISCSDLLAKKSCELLKSFSVDDSVTSKQLEELIENGKELLPNQSFQENMDELKRYKKDFKKIELGKKWDIFLMRDCYEINRTRFSDFETVWNSI